VRLFAIALGLFLLSNPGTRFHFRREGCDTSSVIVADTVYLIHMTKLITCLRDPKSLLEFKVWI
jgi:hypothetical protein